MQLTNAVLALTAAVTVTAHPSSLLGHRHHHKRAPVFYKAVNSNGNSGSSDHAAPAVEGTVKAESVAVSVPDTSSSSSSDAASTTAAAVPTSKPSSSPSGAKPFPCNAASKRATFAQINYKGNTGSPYGCNWMEIDVADVSSYDYTMTFESPDYDVTCQCWNKIGPNLDGTNGQFHDMLSLKLPKGSTKALAIQADTQGSCGCAVGDSVPKGKWGDYLGTWVEVDMGSGANMMRGVPQSGADVSALAVMDNIAATGTHVDFPGMKISANGNFCSGMTANNEHSYHAYVVGTNRVAGQDIHDADGVGCKGYGPNNLKVEIGDVTWDNMGRD